MSKKDIVFCKGGGASKNANKRISKRYKTISKRK